LDNQEDPNPNDEKMNIEINNDDEKNGPKAYGTEHDEGQEEEE